MDILQPADGDEAMQGHGDPMAVGAYAQLTAFDGVDILGTIRFVVIVKIRFGERQSPSVGLLKTADDQISPIEVGNHVATEEGFQPGGRSRHGETASR